MPKYFASCRLLPLLTAACYLLISPSTQAAERLPFLLGADASLAPTMERAGVVFKDAGKPEDIYAILHTHGANCVRLRLFLHPNGKDGVVNDLPYTLALARRVKAAGLLFSLDFHYSDTWADPGHQKMPAAWQDLPSPGYSLAVQIHGIAPFYLDRIMTVARVAMRVREYTAQTLQAFRDAGLTPDVVQIGNEITCGLLWPVGKLYAPNEPEDLGFDQLAVLLQAGVDGVRRGVGTAPMPKIMLHIDGGEFTERVQWFFDRITRRNVPFDLIGLSYYPFYKGTLADLRRTLDAVAPRYGKPVAVVETAYLHTAAPWLNLSEHPGMAFPLSPAGQRDYLQALVKTVRETPGGLGAGVLYWYPESLEVRAPDVDSWWGGKAALFDPQGNALPAFDAFGQP